LRDEPWIYDCAPEDYRFAGGLEVLGDLPVEAVADWDAAIRENRRLVAHATHVRDPDRSARRTLRDLQERVEIKREQCELGPEDEPVRAVLEETAADGNAETHRIDLADLRERATDSTDDACSVTDWKDYALADLVYALRSLGYQDAGNTGTPVFVPR
jgi:DNA integrity scanning protein DisA with diadenylate cyclase activity